MVNCNNIGTTLGIYADYSWTVNTIYKNGQEQDSSNIEIPLLSADLVENWAEYDTVRLKFYKTKNNPSFNLYKFIFKKNNGNLELTTSGDITNLTNLTPYTEDIFRVDIPSGAIYLENDNSITENTYGLYTVKVNGYKLIKIDIKNNLTGYDAWPGKYEREIYFSDTQKDNFWFDLFCVTRKNFLNNEYISNTNHDITETTLFYYNSNKLNDSNASNIYQYIQYITVNYLIDYCNTNPIIYWNILFNKDNQFTEDTWQYESFLTFNSNLYTSGQLYNYSIEIPSYIKTDFVCFAAGWAAKHAVSLTRRD